MTAPYTLAQLEAMPDRELDAAVAEVVMGFEARIPRRCPHTGAVHHVETVIRADLPFYTTSWEGFGLVVERMRKQGIDVEMECDASQVIWDVSFFERGKGQRASAPTLPRATAIAAVLASQGVA